MSEERVRIHRLGHIVQELKGNRYLVALDDDMDFHVEATLCGKMRLSRINLAVGDNVKVELSPYSLDRGRVVWRF